MKNIIIITGATGGVGKQLAKQFLLKGENVCLVARTEKNLEKAKKELSKL